MRLCLLDQRVEVGVGANASHGLREQIILTADHERPDRVLRPIVVDRITSLINIALKVFPLITKIREGLAQRCLRRRSRLGLFKPAM